MCVRVILLLIYSFKEFFTPVLADGFSLEVEWQPVSSRSLQDFSQYVCMYVLLSLLLLLLFRLFCFHFFDINLNRLFNAKATLFLKNRSCSI